ncbi:zinc carboxypeptidase-like [Schistocerca serialis cubense]|uniref:zinc carboxypeptidase-like n=1 Tax=Schistocerca serialis cubense TaxID=2023355 RepID=UPI00214ED081|nr:zinc carboxypeptidase-like [Schistocerca serialis cubense]
MNVYLAVHTAPSENITIIDVQQMISSFNVVTNTVTSITTLKSEQDLIRRENGHIQFWKEPRVVNKPADVMVSPEMQTSFLEGLEANGIQATVYVDNVQTLIDNERGVRRQGESFGWEDYYTLEEIHGWLNSLSETYPDVVTPIVGGSSYEGREILGVNITFAPGNPVVVVEGGIHAGEWIGPATATWIINQILTTNDSAVRDTVRQFNFYVFPNLNPDGYVYTWTTDRNWRGTRTPYTPCYGADPNRNWDFHWGEEGASSTVCSSDFAGPEPFSEVETRTFSEFLASLGDDFQVYLDFHSYGQMLMFQYGLYSVTAPNYDDLLVKLPLRSFELQIDKHSSVLREAVTDRVLHKKLLLEYMGCRIEMIFGKGYWADGNSVNMDDSLNVLQQ